MPFKALKQGCHSFKKMKEKITKELEILKELEIMKDFDIFFYIFKVSKTDHINALFLHTDLSIQLQF